MAIPGVSFLSATTEIIRAHLSAALFPIDSAYEVTVDSPSGVKRHQDRVTDKGALNLFFYRFEPAEFFPENAANERWHVRAKCLVTAFSIDGHETIGGAETGVPAGQIDLRVLGSVMRHFHEKPVILDAAKGLHLEVVPGLLSSEEINQIWVSQHDVPYRPSLLYEFALLPVEPKVYGRPSLPVVAGGALKSVLARIGSPDVQTPMPPQSPYMEGAQGDAWAPLISFVVQTVVVIPGGTQLVARALQSASVDAAPLALWIAAPQGETVRLIWQHVVGGVWTDIAAPAAWPSIVAPVQPQGLQSVIDPDRASVAVTMPVSAPSASPGSYLLYAARPDPAIVGAFIRSNPLILNVGSA
jgi:Pvc16 N-terminal domain